MSNEATTITFTFTFPASNAANDNTFPHCGCVMGDCLRPGAPPMRVRVVGGLKSLLCDGCGKVGATRDGYCDRCHDVEITAMYRRIGLSAARAPLFDGGPDDAA